MRKLLVALDDGLDKKLAGFPNQSQIVRNALELYIEDISTPNTLAGLRQTYIKLTKFMENKFEYYDKVFNDLEKLISQLEMRM